MWLAALLQDEPGTSDSPWWWLVIAPVLALVFLFLYSMRVRRLQMEAWMAKLRFAKQETLPETLETPKNVWSPRPRIREIFEGRYAGFHCVFFQIGLIGNEAITWMPCLAVERGPGGAGLVRAVKQVNADLDERSTPGWIIAQAVSIDVDLQPALKLLTMESWSGVID